MATPTQVEQWLLQAEADLRASEALAADIRENHRRYWIQQAYEKAMKAWAERVNARETVDMRILCRDCGDESRSA